MKRVLWKCISQKINFSEFWFPIYEPESTKGTHGDALGYLKFSRKHSPLLDTVQTTSLRWLMVSALDPTPFLLMSYLCEDGFRAFPMMNIGSMKSSVKSGARVSLSSLIPKFEKILCPIGTHILLKSNCSFMKILFFELIYIAFPVVSKLLDINT